MADEQNVIHEVKQLKGNIVEFKDLKAGDAIQNKNKIPGFPNFFVIKQLQGPYFTAIYEMYGMLSQNWKTSPPPTTLFKRLEGKKSVELKEAAEKYTNTTGILVSCQQPLSRTLGADPEIFVENDSGDIIPAFLFLPDKKNAARNDFNTAYWDGFQAEFTLTSDTCLGWVADRLQLGLKLIYRKAKQFDKNAYLSTKTLIKLPEGVLASSSPEHVEFGCSPSLNIYGLKGDLDAGGRAIPFRSAGGHIHFGIGKLTETQYTNIVQALDAILGVCCVSLFADYDSPMRRKFYGLPGEFRLPAHGLEYRVLSNAWLIHPVVANLVLDFSRQVCNFGYNGELYRWKATKEETIQTLLNCDVVKARQIMMNNKQLIKLFISSIYNKQSAETAFNCMYNGINSFVENPNDIIGNWRLDKEWIAHCDGHLKNWTHSWQHISKGGKV